MNEFDLINRYFAPLAGEGGLSLLDDAAVYTPPMGQDLVITKDMLVADVHFYADDDPRAIAIKALGVNLSDCAAKGATPQGYLLGLSLPKDIDDNWLKNFAAGLGDMQELHGFHLLGGDTVKTEGPLTISITLFGSVLGGAMVKRSGAKVGDLVMVTGDIGAAALGLKMREGIIESLSEYALERYLFPRPRVGFGMQMSHLVTAGMDISDGLIADAGHMATASKVAIKITLGAIPISESLSDSMTDRRALEWILTGGDDYELLITARPDRQSALMELADRENIMLTVIGEVTDGAGVALVDDEGNEIPVGTSGYKHFND